MTIDELKVRPDFVAGLTDQQKDFVLTYCENGADKIEAARAAYQCKSPQAAMANANRCLSHPTIKRLVNDFFEVKADKGSKDDVLVFLWGKIQTGGLEPKYLFEALDLYTDISGFRNTKKETPSSEPEVGSTWDLVAEMEKKQKGV